MAEPEDPTTNPTEISPVAGSAPSQGAKRLDNFALEGLLGAGRPGGARGNIAWELPALEELRADFPLYEIVSVLGRGGMGAVYKGRQKSLDRFVAIKILPPEVQDCDPHFADRFKHEAKAMARLSHPAICPVFDAGVTPGGLLYFVMEFIEGGDLGQKIAAQGRLASAEAVAIAEAVCDALQLAHESGIVHRDIKPSNILLDIHGQWKVADFGLAKVVGHSSGDFTLTDTAMGSVGFASPEALTDGARVDHRADIYAVGVILYEMLTGHIPRGAFDMPSQVVPGLDPRFDVIVAKAMQPDRERRYASAGEMRRDLDAIGAVVRPRSFAATRESRATAYRWVVIAAGLMVLIGGGWWLLHRAKSAAPPGVAGSKPTPDGESQFVVNSLGMKFIPVPINGGPTDGQRVLFSVWETRVQDYEVFAAETKREWPKVDFAQEPTHPAVNVTWDDAQAFCAWLTARERKAGRLSATERYRLPTDHEWSCAVGLGEREDAAKSMEEKSGEFVNIFPWGGTWPPPPRAGNYSGDEAVGHETWKGQSILRGYHDNFPQTAPVGSFAANGFGLFDLGGNAWEWCDDLYKPTQASRVMRGASFNNGGRGGLYSAKRDQHPPEDRQSSYGFRIVIAETAASKSAATIRPIWRPVPFKLNPVLAGGFVHLVKFDSWAGPKFQITNAAVRAVIAWQPDLPGRNDYIKVTARLRADEHYYAYLTGPSVEVGFYQAHKVTPLQRWAVTPPPEPGEAMPLQLACIGSHLAVWIRGKLLGIYDDPTLTGAGNVGVQAGDGHIQNLEYLDLDSLPEGDALQFLDLADLR